MSDPKFGEPCRHDKVYADYILTSNPPQMDWVCRICGSRGRDVCGRYTGRSEYDELIRRF